MNVDHLRELNDLFEHRHDALILLCLARGVADAADQPLRFRQLARSIIKQTGSYVPESNISRSLPRLRDAKLVAVHGADTRHPSYRPTLLGAQKAELVTFLLQAIDNRPAGPDDDDDDDDEPTDS